MKRFLLVFFVLISFGMYSQDKTFCELKSNNNSLIWYGYDFSQFTLTEPDLIEKKGLMKNKFIPLWSNRINSVYYPNRMKRLLRFDSFEDLSKVSKNSHSEIITNNFISDDVIKFDTLSLSKIINKLPNNNEGIGLIVVFERFNKYKESGSAYFVFFNNSSKTILHLLRIENILKEGGWGTEKHIGLRLELVVDRFWTKYNRAVRGCKN